MVKENMYLKKTGLWTRKKLNVEKLSYKATS